MITNTFLHKNSTDLYHQSPLTFTEHSIMWNKFSEPISQLSPLLNGVSHYYLPFLPTGSEPRSFVLLPFVTGHFSNTVTQHTHWHTSEHTVTHSVHTVSEHTHTRARTHAHAHTSISPTRPAACHTHCGVCVCGVCYCIGEGSCVFVYWHWMWVVGVGVCV